MKLENLRSCLEGFNRKAFERLEKQHALPFPNDQTAAARQYVSGATGNLIDRAVNVGRFDGRNAADGFTRDGVETWINFPATPPDVRRVAVGAVIDGREDDADAPDLSPEGMPVVLSVDMNHGWRHQPGNGPVSALPGLFADTGLREAVELVVGDLGQRNRTMQGLTPKFYHLVAAGFFPWTTVQPWAAATRDACGEEFLQRYFGWRNPLEFVVELIRTLHAECRELAWDRGLTQVIFHGASGAVTRAGLAAAGQLTRDPDASAETLPLHRSDRPAGDWAHPDHARRMGPDVIFCDDLVAVAAGKRPEHAVWLWQQDLTGEFDMDGLLE